MVYSLVAQLTDDKGADDLTQSVEHKSIRDVQILVTDPVLLRYRCLLVVRVVVLVAMCTGCGGIGRRRETEGDRDGYCLSASFGSGLVPRTM